MFTELLPICSVDVVKLTFAPTLAPEVKLPVFIETKVLLTTAVPILKSDEERFAVDVISDTFNNIELAKILAVLLPI